MDLWSGLNDAEEVLGTGSLPCAWQRCGDGRGMLVDAQASGAWKARGALPTDPQRVAEVLKRDATARRVVAKGASPKVGDTVGVRLNLNILSSQGVCVHTVHRGGSVDKPRRGGGYWNGEVLDYREVVTLKSAWFSVHQAGRQAIAAGEAAKFPMASVDGILSEANSNADGVEVRFNPKRTHLFLDSNGFAVRWAEEVTVIGHRAYARGRIVYHTVSTAPALAPGSAASEARLRSV